MERNFKLVSVMAAHTYIDMALSDSEQARGSPEWTSCQVRKRIFLANSGAANLAFPTEITERETTLTRCLSIRLQGACWRRGFPCIVQP